MEDIVLKEEESLQSIFNFYSAVEKFPKKPSKKRLNRYDLHQIANEFRIANRVSKRNVGVLLLQFAIPIFILLISLFLVVSGLDKFFLKLIGLYSLNFISKLFIIFLIYLFRIQFNRPGKKFYLIR